MSFANWIFQSDPSISCAVEERNPEDAFNKRRRVQQEEEGREEQIPNPTALSLSLSLSLGSLASCSVAALQNPSVRV
jgi:hypothetical protein